MITEKQREERRKGIGGSDAKLIMAGEWLALYQQKIDGTRLDPSLQMDVGSATEHVNLAWLGKMFELTPVIVPDTLWHELHKPLLMNIDAYFVDKQGRRVLIEATHVNAWSKPEQVIQRKFAQCQHGLLFGFDYAVISTLYDNGTKLEPYVVEADPAWVAEYLDRAESFWWHVESRTPPEDLAPAKEKAARVAILGTKTYDMTGNNAWADCAERLVGNQYARDVWEEAKEGIKKLMPADAKLAEGHGVRLKRDKRGVTVEAA